MAGVGPLEVFMMNDSCGRGKDMQSDLCIFPQGIICTIDSTKNYLSKGNRPSGLRTTLRRSVWTRGKRYNQLDLNISPSTLSLSLSRVGAATGATGAVGSAIGATTGAVGGATGATGAGETGVGAGTLPVKKQSKQKKNGGRRGDVIETAVWDC